MLVRTSHLESFFAVARLRSFTPCVYACGLVLAKRGDDRAESDIPIEFARTETNVV
jgi:hypothetical protein